MNKPAESSKDSPIFTKLRKIELQQKAILDNIPDIAWLKDEQSRFIMVNERFGKTCGFKPEELIGKTDLDIWPVDLAQSYRADDQEVIKSKKRKCVQERLSDKEGKVAWIETIKTPIFDSEGKVIGTAGIARDITQRKKDEESQKEIRNELELRVKVRTAELTSLNEELRKEISSRKKIENDLSKISDFLNKVFNSIQDGISILDNKMKIVQVNPTMEKWYDYSMPVIGKKCFEAYHQRNKPCDVCPVKETLKTQKPACFVIPKEDKDGKIIGYFDLYSFPMFDENSKELTGVIEYVRDISDRVKNENELKKYHENLENLVEERTKLLLEEINLKKISEGKANELNRQIEFILGATKTGLDIIDKDYNIRYIDSVWASIYGDWKEKKCFDYFMGRKEPCLTCTIEKALKTKKTVVSEEVLVKENNRPIQVTTIPFQDINGEWLVAEINLDISQRKKIDEELNHYRDNLEQLVAERTNELLQETIKYKNTELERNKLNRELVKINTKLKNVALVDPHTNLYNYRYLSEIIEAEFYQARRYAQNLSIIMLDVDYFKSINDVYGIAFGDLVLKQLAKELKHMVRRYDILVRYSGEEFIIISPRLDRNAAFNMAQRLLDSLNFINFGNKKHNVKLKLSFAVVSFPEDRVKSGIDLVNLANKVLDKAKESGGNRTYSTLDIKSPLKKGIENISKAIGVKKLKNTIDKLHKQSKQGLIESIFAFAKTLELKDHYTGEHVENTVHFATEIAKGLNLSKEDVELIKQAAMLHDLGKIGISESILLKKGKLSKKEFDEIKKHPQIGADIIRPIQFLQGLIPFIFYHHERWDGKGYPSRIKGEDIPMGARIIAIADVYQALISNRPYHKAFTKNKAIEIIKKGSGTQFDPRIVSIFLKIINKKK